MKKYNTGFVSVCAFLASGIILSGSAWADDTQSLGGAQADNAATTSDPAQPANTTPTIDFAKDTDTATTPTDNFTQTAQLKPGIFYQTRANRLSADRPQFVQDEIIVKTKGDKKHFRVVKVPRGHVDDKIKEYQNMTDVESAQPNYIAYASMVPADPYYQFQWNMDNPTNRGIHMEDAWESSTGKNSVIVAVIDTGIAYENNGIYCQAPDLSQTNFTPGWDFVNNTAHANDDNGHGTHVAGTLAQSTNNNQGFAGVAFNTTLMPIKVLDNSGIGSYANVASGIYYAADHGAKVINLSLGGNSPDTTLQDAVKYAHDKGVTVVAACGNENTSSCLYPAAYNQYVIAVGATRFDQTKTSYSSYGPEVDIMAPGGDTSADQNGDGYPDGIFQETFNGPSNTCGHFGYWLLQGTSMAAPHVSGVAALLIANGGAAMPDQIKTLLETTAADLGAPGRDDTYGWGLINAAKALDSKSKPKCSPTSDCNDNNSCTLDTCPNYGTAAARCVHVNKPDNSNCEAGICCAGKCAAAACSKNADCSDDNSCTTDICNNSGKCAATCAAKALTKCFSGDGCCPANCAHKTDGDCKAIKCWSGSNGLLYPAPVQLRKFCKCAQGNFTYNSFKSAAGKQTAWKYSSASNNSNWAVAPITASKPIISVICSDRKTYPTNQDYAQ